MEGTWVLGADIQMIAKHPNKSLKLTPRAGRKSKDEALRRSLAPRR